MNKEILEFVEKNKELFKDHTLEFCMTFIDGVDMGDDDDEYTSNGFQVIFSKEVGRHYAGLEYYSNQDFFGEFNLEAMWEDDEIVEYLEEHFEEELNHLRSLYGKDKIVCSTGDGY